MASIINPPAESVGRLPGVTQPTLTDNFNPGQFTGGTTPNETSAADSFAGAVRPPWSRGFGDATPKPYNGYDDVAKVGVGTVGPTPTTTYKG